MKQNKYVLYIASTNTVFFKDNFPLLPGHVNLWLNASSSDSFKIGVMFCSDAPRYSKYDTCNCNKIIKSFTYILCIVAHINKSWLNILTTVSNSASLSFSNASNCSIFEIGRHFGFCGIPLIFFLLFTFSFSSMQASLLCIRLFEKIRKFYKLWKY